jgi:hypothetical protein
MYPYELLQAPTTINNIFCHWNNFRFIIIMWHIILYNYLWFKVILIYSYIFVAGICMRNCAQCQIMFGAYFFMGEKCANFCIKYKGKLIPNCEDEFSIRPFLQKVPESEY